ncbi:NXPE family member 3-like [Haliotis rubra]|uniref:NXPE family member 3-like n=1 Tax=Haliotis rubra TaxID=36100 RepID=UPI001EE57020|nr:NXPE family member 3-like [Haliotis rubra]
MCNPNSYDSLRTILTTLQETTALGTMLETVLGTDHDAYQSSTVNEDSLQCEILGWRRWLRRVGHFQRPMEIQPHSGLHPGDLLDLHLPNAEVTEAHKSLKSKTKPEMEAFLAQLKAMVDNDDSASIISSRRTGGGVVSPSHGQLEGACDFLGANIENVVKQLQKVKCVMTLTMLQSRRNRRCAVLMTTCGTLLLISWCLYNSSSSTGMVPTSISVVSSKTESEGKENDRDISIQAHFTHPRKRLHLPLSSDTGVADPLYSEVHITGMDQFQVGDVINVSIMLKDEEGKRVDTGGDDVRIWMKSIDGRYRTSGHVVDHGNGSYTGIIRAFWEGHPVILVSIAWTRQLLNIKDRLRSANAPYTFIYALFGKGPLREVTRCNITKTTEKMCNYTERNGGHPWFCERPQTKLLSCSTLKSHQSVVAGDYHTPAEKLFIKRHPPHQILRRITTSITRGTFRPLSRTSCSELPASHTWKDDFSSGYSSRDNKTTSWYSQHCRYSIQHTVLDYKRCLTNKRLWLYGDSTTRQWFEYISRFLGKEMVLYEKYKPQVAYLSDTNSSIFCGPHEFPFNTGNGWTNAMFNKPLKQYLDKIPSYSRDIVVFHVLAHLVNFGPDVFRGHIRRNVKSIREFILRVPKAIVVVKGTSTFRRFERDKFGDMNAMSYDPILKEEFSLIKDRVIFLDFIPMTLAFEVPGLHPNAEVVKLMVHHFMGSVCGRN